MDASDDIESMADLGWGPEQLAALAAVGISAGAFATFMSLDPDTRALVLRLLDRPNDQDEAELSGHPSGTAIAQWLLTLSADSDAPGQDEE